MNCKNHPTQDVVALCSLCNQGVCRECANTTSALREEYGTLCTSCYTAEIKKDNKRRVKNIIINSVLYLIGIIILCIALSNGAEGLSMAIIGILFCGFYCAISGWKKSKSKRKRKNKFLKRLFVSLIFAVFGVIVTPINVIRDIVRIHKNGKLLKTAN